MDENMVVIGRVRRAHGTKGELLLEILTDFPERFAGLEQVFLVSPAPEEIARPMSVDEVRRHPEGLILRLTGVADRSRAESYRRFLVAVPRAQAVPLPPGEYYFFELVGLEVVSTKGERVGRLREVHRFPANDVYEVWDEKQEREILLPAIDEVVRDIDIERGIVTVELLEGLVD